MLKQFFKRNLIKIITIFMVGIICRISLTYNFDYSLFVNYSTFTLSYLLLCINSSWDNYIYNIFISCIKFVNDNNANDKLIVDSTPTEESTKYLSRIYNLWLIDQEFPKFVSQHAGKTFKCDASQLKEYQNLMKEEVCKGHNHILDIIEVLPVTIRIVYRPYIRKVIDDEMSG